MFNVFSICKRKSTFVIKTSKMKKYICILTLALLMGACTSSSNKKKDGEHSVLTVTIEPQRFFLEKMAGNKFTINTLVPPGTSPETYEPSPSVMIEMGKSAIYFRVGNLGFENVWAKSLAENNPHVKVVNCSQGIALMDGHEHCLHGDEEHDRTHAGDPHVWSSPKAMLVFVRNMYDALVAYDTDNKAHYTSNLEEVTRIIETTDSIVSHILKDADSRSFVIYHPALGYFARDYNLTQHSIEFEGKNPSPSQIKDLIDVAKKEKVNTVFVQKGFDVKNAEVVAKELGAKVYEINPLAYEWSQELVRIANIIARNNNE